MANCTKCGSHIKVYQMSPYCKNCGTHLMFASFEQQFEKDRRIAEMSMAFFRYALIKVKSAYVGGLAQKLKIAAAFFPLIALFLPMGNLSINTPLYSSSLNFDLFGIFIGPFLSTGLFGKLDALSAGPVFGGVASALKPLMLCYAFMAVCAVLILLLELLSFIGNKAVCILTCVFSSLGIIGAVLVKVFSSGVVKSCADTGSLVSASDNVLFIVAILLFAIPLAASVYAVKRPPLCIFREGDELRVEYRRKYKKGLIELMDIPAPIYESEEDKKEREKLIKDAYNISDSEEEVTVNA